MGKLVRDKIPEIMIVNKQNPKIKIVKNDSEYIEALHNKLLEEVNEFIEASSTNKEIESIQEIADVLEVIDAICEHKKYNHDLIRSSKLKKKQERGGFENRILLINA